MRIVEFWDYISREDLKANPDKIFLFGDNVIRQGYGGQAKEMRGEPNARGIATKRRPDNDYSSYFHTNPDWKLNFKSLQEIIDGDFSKIPDDVTVVIPKSGIGTGLAKLKEYCPELLDYINRKIGDL